MDHQSARELFSDYLDGELSGEQGSELEAHLRTCADCQRELDALKQTLGSLGQLAPVTPPPEFVRKVQQRIRRRSRGRFFAEESVLSRIPFEWISFVIIILMLVWYFMLLQGTQVKPQPVGGNVEPPRTSAPR